MRSRPLYPRNSACQAPQESYARGPLRLPNQLPRVLGGPRFVADWPPVRGLSAYTLLASLKGPRACFPLLPIRVAVSVQTALGPLNPAWVEVEKNSSITCNG
eukprot:scaffold647820_cov50-Prasinocladus_malaysianus.AAC.2